MIIPPTLRMKMRTPPRIWTAAMMTAIQPQNCRLEKTRPSSRKYSFWASAVTPQSRLSAPALTRYVPANVIQPLRDCVGAGVRAGLVRVAMDDTLAGPGVIQRHPDGMRHRRSTPAHDAR